MRRKLTIQTVKSLAIRYNAYREACRERNYTEIACWGPLLIETMEQTGIELADVINVLQMVNIAKRHIADAATKAKALAALAPLAVLSEPAGDIAAD